MLFFVFFFDGFCFAEVSISVGTVYILDELYGFLDFEISLSLALFLSISSLSLSFFLPSSLYFPLASSFFPNLFRSFSLFLYLSPSSTTLIKIRVLQTNVCGFIYLEEFTFSISLALYHWDIVRHVLSRNI